LLASQPFRKGVKVHARQWSRPGADHHAAFLERKQTGQVRGAVGGPQQDRRLAERVLAAFSPRADITDALPQYDRELHRKAHGTRCLSERLS
jgi:hypothetical protein